MTDHDQTARPEPGRHDHAAPAASLTRVSIRRARRPAAEPEPRCDDAPPVIELRADVASDRPANDAGRPPNKVFPSAHVRSFGETAATEPNQQPEAPPGVPITPVAPSAIIDLWEHLATDRLRPNISDVDPLAIAGQWPNSLLLRVTEQGRRPGLEVAHMFAPPAGGPTSAIPIDAMTVDWIVGLGREVVITGGPVHETDAVPTGSGPINCGVIALPFGPDAGVDHVLCHLYRVDESVVESAIDAEIALPPRDRTGIKRLFGR